MKARPTLPESREIERRSPQSRPRRAPAQAAPDPDGVLRRAVQRVVATRSELWRSAALSAEEGARLAGHLLTTLETAEPPTGVTLSGAERTLVVRLVDLTRRELLDGPEQVRDVDMVVLLRKLEAARARFEPEGRHLLAAGLTGVNGLDLVIELAHDLRSPLTSIMFLSETLRRGQSGPITDIQRQQLGIIYSAALGLVSVANDLMDLSRDGNPAGLTEFRAEPFSLADILESVHNMVRPMLEEKRLKLVYHLPDEDVRIGKPVPLNRTLLNLVTNAIKFTEEGHVEVVVRDTHGVRAEVSVRDTGRGMDEETVRSLYDTFRRGQTGTGYRFSDTGLGMSLCRRMVGIMGGQLNVRSEPGAGTRFWFEIDLPPAGYRDP